MLALEQEWSALTLKAAMIRNCLNTLRGVVIEDPETVSAAARRHRTRGASPDATPDTAMARLLSSTDGAVTWGQMQDALQLDRNVEYPILGQYKPFLTRKRGGACSRRATCRCTHGARSPALPASRARECSCWVVAHAACLSAAVTGAETYEEKLASLSEAKVARRVKCHPETADGGAIGSGLSVPTGAHLR